MITYAKLEETVIVTEEIDNIQMMAIVTLGAGHDENSVSEMNGSINMMLFIDAYFTDRALMDSYMYATEAKVKALARSEYSRFYYGHIHRYPNDWPYTARDETKLRRFRNECRKRNS